MGPLTTNTPMEQKIQETVAEVQSHQVTIVATEKPDTFILQQKDSNILKITLLSNTDEIRQNCFYLKKALDSTSAWTFDYAPEIGFIILSKQQGSHTIVLTNMVTEPSTTTEMNTIEIAIPIDFSPIEEMA